VSPADNQLLISVLIDEDEADVEVEDGIEPADVAAFARFIPR